MYTVLKTVTAVKLAAQLKTAVPRARFRAGLLARGRGPRLRGGQLPRPSSTPNSGSSGSSTCPAEAFRSGIRARWERSCSTPRSAPAFARLESDLVDTEFKEALLATLRGCYREGQTFITAFASWMNFLFEEHGLVFLSPNDPRLKRLLSPLFTKEIEEFPATSQLVISRSAELEQLYHAQVKPKSLNLFLFHKGGRYLIEPRETDFSLKGTRHFLSKDELLRIARETPEQLSPNVVLRPIIAGSPASHDRLRRGPVRGRVPRAACPRVQALRRRRARDLPARQRVVRGRPAPQGHGEVRPPARRLLRRSCAAVARVVGQISEVNVDSMFGAAAQRMQEALNELRFGIKEIDPTLLSVLETVKSKTEGNLSA